MDDLLVAARQTVIYETLCAFYTVQVRSRRVQDVCYEHNQRHEALSPEERNSGIVDLDAKAFRNVLYKMLLNHTRSQLNEYGPAAMIAQTYGDHPIARFIGDILLREECRVLLDWYEPSQPAFAFAVTLYVADDSVNNVLGLQVEVDAFPKPMDGILMMLWSYHRDTARIGNRAFAQLLFVLDHPNAHPEALIHARQVVNTIIDRHSYGAVGNSIDDELMIKVIVTEEQLQARLDIIYGDDSTDAEKELIGAWRTMHYLQPWYQYPEGI